jgi:hypothetical protein
MLGAITKYYYTIRDLKWIQIVYQIRYKLLKPRFKSLEYPGILNSLSFEIKTPSVPIVTNSSIFTFLNLEKTFGDKIDWAFKDFGLLWNYNLNYFDFLHQDDVDKDHKLDFISSFIEGEGANFDPYPTSVRLINWILLVSKNEVEDRKVIDSIYSQARHLSRFLEYHLLGNHLLENGFALLFAAYYLSEDRFYHKAKSIIHAELEEQILKDGAHFERSPMYHKIMLFRIMQTIDLIRKNGRFVDEQDLLETLENKAKMMLGWLTHMTFENGDFGRFNDSAGGIAVETAYLFELAQKLSIPIQHSPLSDSGYRKFRGTCFEGIMDVGSLEPKYIPGHAHADIAHFVVHYKKQPFIVDRGVSTYEKNEVRHNERSTNAHNTVVVAGHNQSNIWGGFRVAQKAEVCDFKEQMNETIVSHDGYKWLGANHERRFQWTSKCLTIKDRVSGVEDNVAYFHFYPTVELSKVGTRIMADDCKIEIAFARLITIEDYDYAVGFNKKVSGKRLCISFTDHLTTKLIFE